MMKRIVFLTVAAAACISTASLKAEAQTGPQQAQKMDARFNGWLGCWRLEDDIAGTGARMCITPDRAGVRLQTLVGTHKGIDELVIADGVARSIVDTECKGTEVAEWSNDGQRVFRTTEVTCNNEGKRTIKSLAFLAPGPMWINVQHVSGQGTTANVRAQRYRRALNQNLADGSKAAQPATAVPLTDTRWSIEDVIEASNKVPAEAVQAALTDVRQKFNISKKTLLELDEAGVDDSVIDLMVALTFPDRFVVERAVGASAPIGVSTGMGWYDPFLSPMWSGSYASCYTPNGYYGYRSYYNMCGSNFYGYNTFSPYGSYYPYDNYYPGSWVPVGTGSGDLMGPSGEGRVVNGRGYTQIRERSPEPTGSSRSNNGGNGTASGWSGNSGGGVSSGGYSSGSSSGGSSGGSSSGGGDRTAVARPPGGGN